jgi:hypothetical protein
MSGGMWFRVVSSDDICADDSTLTEWLRNTPQTENIDWWKVTMDVRVSESSTDVGGCDSSNVVASDNQTVFIIKIV